MKGIYTRFIFLLVSVIGIHFALGQQPTNIENEKERLIDWLTNKLIEPLPNNPIVKKQDNETYMLITEERMKEETNEEIGNNGDITNEYFTSQSAIIKFEPFKLFRAIFFLVLK